MLSALAVDKCYRLAFGHGVYVPGLRLDESQPTPLKIGTALPPRGRRVFSSPRFSKGVLHFSQQNAELPEPLEDRAMRPTDALNYPTGAASESRPSSCVSRVLSVRGPVPGNRGWSSLLTVFASSRRCFCALAGVGLSHIGETAVSAVMPELSELVVAFLRGSLDLLSG